MIEALKMRGVGREGGADGAMCSKMWGRTRSRP